MICSFCENPISPGARYCSQCGTAIMNRQAANPYVAPKPDYYGGPHSVVGVGIQRTSTMSIVSLIAGVAAWSVLPVIGAMVAIVTGHVARREIRESAGRTDGGPMATIGLVLGYSQIVLLFLVLFVALVTVGVAVVSHH